MRSRKVILNTLALTTFSAALLLLVNFHTARIGLSSIPLEFESVSPDKTYRVVLVERRETKVLPFYFLFDPPGSPAEFSAYKNGRPLFEKTDIGDDSNYFADLFPDHAWMSDSVLRLGEGDAPGLEHDVLDVNNSSRQVISYLRVRTCKCEMFWLFSVRPGETVRLSACAQADGHADLSWVDFSGMFEGGREIPFTGKNFEIRGVHGTPSRYSITVSDDAAKVESAGLQEVYR
jgi:hypothetical protein